MSKEPKKPTAEEFEGEDMDGKDDDAWHKEVSKMQGKGADLGDMVRNLMESVLNGGKGSGNYGHKGRPGKIGGSTDRDMPKRKETAAEKDLRLHPHSPAARDAYAKELADRLGYPKDRISYQDVPNEGEEGYLGSYFHATADSPSHVVIYASAFDERDPLLTRGTIVHEIAHAQMFDGETNKVHQIFDGWNELQQAQVAKEARKISDYSKMYFDRHVQTWSYYESGLTPNFNVRGVKRALTESFPEFAVQYALNPESAMSSYPFHWRLFNGTVDVQYRKESARIHNAAIVGGATNYRIYLDGRFKIVDQKNAVAVKIVNGPDVRFEAVGNK